MQPSTNQSDFESSVDYDRSVSELPSHDLEGVISHLSSELPHVWADLYKERSPHSTNIMRIDRDGFEYLFDFPTELVKQGTLAWNVAVEDRIVAVHGRSQPQKRKRTDHLMRKHPLGPAGFIRTHSAEPSKLTDIYDKGHFIGHAMGGALHINLFPQTKDINRGLSKEGKKYTEMERYCRRHPQTYCFSRPIYSGYSAHPEVIEFGVLRHDGTLWVNQFPNCKDSEEMDLMERLFRAKLAGGDDESLQRLL
jgi:hypothetical protein